MADDENNLSDDLSFMSLLTCLDDANFDKLFPRIPDEYQKHENSDDMLIKKNSVEEFFDEYEKFDIKPVFKKIDLNNSDKDQEENKSKDAYIIGFDFSF